MAKKQSMTEQVLQALRNDIINWNYAENDMITEAEISAKFGVSKTPSREALNYLCVEGFLEKIPNKGYLIKGVSITELQSLLQFRGVLEKASTEMAIQYATNDELSFLRKNAEDHLAQKGESTYQEYSKVNMQFHMSIAYLSRNKYLVSALEGILNQLRRVLVKDWNSIEAAYFMEEHLKLVDALAERNVERAKQFVEKELGGVENRLYFRESKKF